MASIAPSSTTRPIDAMNPTRSFVLLAAFLASLTGARTWEPVASRVLKKSNNFDPAEIFDAVSESWGALPVDTVRRMIREIVNAINARSTEYQMVLYALPGGAEYRWTHLPTDEEAMDRAWGKMEENDREREGDTPQNIY